MINNWYSGIIITVCFLLCFTLTANVAKANKQEIQLYVNDQYVSDIVPIVKSGVMYVPLRKFLNHFGYKVQYDQELNGVYENGHWNYSNEFDLQTNNYDRTEDFLRRNRWTKEGSTGLVKLQSLSNL